MRGKSSIGIGDVRSSDEPFVLQRSFRVPKTLRSTAALQCSQPVHLRFEIDFYLIANRPADKKGQLSSWPFKKFRLR